MLLVSVGAGADAIGAGAAAGSGAATESGAAALTAVTAAATPPAAAAANAETTIGASTTAIWMAACMNGQKIIRVWKMAQPRALDRAGEKPIWLKNEARPLTTAPVGTASHRG